MISVTLSNLHTIVLPRCKLVNLSVSEETVLTQLLLSGTVRNSRLSKFAFVTLTIYTYINPPLRQVISLFKVTLFSHTLHFDAFLLSQIC